MADRYQQFAQSAPGRFLVKRLGLPNPVPLRRYAVGGEPLAGPAVIGAAKGGRLGDTLRSVLDTAGINLLEPEGAVASPDGKQDKTRLGALVFDATGIDSPQRLRELYEFFHPLIRRLGACGRVLVLGSPPEQVTDAREAIAQRALEGFTRSVGKELKRGATVQLVYVAPGAEAAAESTLRFLLSAKSAYVSAQVIRIGTQPLGAPAEPESWLTPLAGKVALVTGAARGIGAAIAEVLARDGAHVVALDIPAQSDELAEVAKKIGGSSLGMDITASTAPAQLVEHFTQQHGGVDIVVHNAGITRDKTLGNMSEAQWDAVLAVNLASQLDINDALLAGDTLRPGGRIIGVSSIAGIAGNVGQTNYGASKAGVIGMVHKFAPVLAARDATINAVAPGFIETKMTAAVPLFIRQAGRWLNGMSQGGLPVDVAETIAWYANPASYAVNGNVVRVCGQSLLGA
jgi:3-oxoacyl-[acyl-carrier protein] reductase